jgi:hypothetical protein
MRNQLVGRRTRRMIRLGDRLTVQVAKVDTFKKQVDFWLAGTATRRPAPVGIEADVPHLGFAIADLAAAVAEIQWQSKFLQAPAVNPVNGGGLKL